MTISWLPVVVVDILGSISTLILAIYSAIISWKWLSKKTDDIFRQYIFLLTVAIVCFAISRSFGHLIKQVLVLNGFREIWKQLSPFSGAINSAIFIVIFAFSIYFQRFQKINLQIEQYQHHLEELVDERTEELNESKAVIENVLNNSNPMSITSLDYDIIMANKAYYEVFDGPNPDNSNHKCYESRPGPSCKTENCPINHILSGDALYELEVDKLTRDSRQQSFIVTARPFINAEDELIGVIENFQDITQLKKYEQDLEKARRIDSIGVLAGGIAHDFNNILTAITGNISLAKMQMDPESNIGVRLEEAEKACWRATGLTQQLITFSKGGAPIKKTASISELLFDSANFVLRGSNVKCEFSVQEDLSPCEIDDGQISQVINNMIINADQAMSEGGKIVISAENISLDESEGLPLPQGRYVKISITDEGDGIAAESLDKIFDPYFTTKEKGSGLGLASSYSIIKKHHGLITVESTVGKGSKFSIFIPATFKTPSQIAESQQIPEAGQEKILIMDDEEAVREIASGILKHLGYEVILAADGSIALEQYQKAIGAGRPFDAVILDLTIPGGVGGMKTIKKLLEIDPEVKAIVSSGFSSDPVLAAYKDYGFSGVVLKPYSSKDIANELQRVLATKA